MQTTTSLGRDGGQIPDNISRFSGALLSCFVTILFKFSANIFVENLTGQNIIQSRVFYIIECFWKCLNRFTQVTLIQFQPL